MDDSLGVHALHSVDQLEKDGGSSGLCQTRLPPQPLQQLPSSQHLHHQVHMQLDDDERETPLYFTTHFLK